MRTRGKHACTLARVLLKITLKRPKREPRDDTAALARKPHPACHCNPKRYAQRSQDHHNHNLGGTLHVWQPQVDSTQSNAAGTARIGVRPGLTAHKTGAGDNRTERRRRTEGSQQRWKTSGLTRESQLCTGPSSAPMTAQPKRARKYSPGRGGDCGRDPVDHLNDRPEGNDNR